MNSAAWNGVEPNFIKGTLDSSLKKNFTLVRKFKILGHEQEKSILKDISTLALDKYLPELIPALVEGCLRCKKNEDVRSAVEIISLLHQRFTYKFTPQLLNLFGTGIEESTQLRSKIYEDEDPSTLSKRRACLRFFTELLFVGVFQDNVRNFCDEDLVPSFMLSGSAKVDSSLYSVVKRVTSPKLSNLTSVSIVVNYLKKFSSLFMDKDFTCVSEPAKEAIVQQFTTYSELVVERTSKTKVALNNKNTKQNDISMKTGKLVEGMQSEIEQLSEEFEKLKSCSIYLCDLFKLPVPQFENERETELRDSLIVGVNSTRLEHFNDLMWESEHVKKFYTVIPDITKMVSQDLLTVETLKPPGAETVSLMGSKMSEFLDMLDNASSVEDVDKAAVFFWNLQLNNKASRNRLMKVFLETKELNKLKYLARFLAINREYLKDVIAEIIDYLDKRFRSQIHSDRINLKFITLFCELIKFELIPAHVIFHKIRSLILNISSSNNIEILSVVFDNCGKFLLNHLDFQVPMLEMIDLLSKRRDHLNSSYRSAVDSMMLILKAPSVKDLNKPDVKHSVEEQFLIQLLMIELNNSNVSKVLNILRKFEFERNEVLSEKLKEIFTSPSKINFNDIGAMARLIKLFTNSSGPLLTHTIDTVIENIIRDLELNDYRSNRTRLANVNFLVQFTNVSVLHINTLINIMYRILSMGHPQNNPQYGKFAPLDPPDNYFRISLICQILSKLNVDKIRLGQFQKIELFLSYFDYYINTKVQPIPMDTNFKIVEMIERVKPDYVRAKSLKESIEKLQEMMLLVDVNGADEDEDELEENLAEDSILKAKPIQFEYAKEDEDGDDDDGEGEDDEDEVDQDEDEEDIEDDDSVEDEDEDEDEEEDEDDDSDEGEDEEDEDDDEEDEEVTEQMKSEEYALKLRQAQDSLWEQNLDNEMKKIIAESMKQRKYEKVDRFSAPLPLASKGAELESKSNSVQFRLLARKDKKNVSTTTIDLPTNFKFASRVLEEEQRQRDEKDRLKRIVMSMNDSDR